MTIRDSSRRPPAPRRLALLAGLAFLVPLAPAALAQEWLPVLKAGLRSDYSQRRHDAVKQIDVESAAGLKVLWKVLESRGKDPLRLDWYVREAAFEALSKGEGKTFERGVRKLLEASGSPSAKEAVVYSVVWKIRKDFVKDYGGNEDRKIEEAKYLLRKTRGLEYFKLMLPRLEKFDPQRVRFGWLRKAFADKSPRVRVAALNAFLFYPDDSVIQLLLDDMVRLDKRSKKGKRYRKANFREWIVNRYALEQLSGQYYRDNVQDWLQWWTVAKDHFSLQKRIEEELGEGSGKGRTVVVRRGGVEVAVNMTIAGKPDGYPLLVLPWRGYEPEYFRPYFHGVEEFARTYYLLMPQFDDFKGLARGAADNIPRYPTEKLVEILRGYMDDTGIEHMAVLGHGPSASTLALMLAAKAPERITHAILINPSYAGSEYGKAIESVRRVGVARKNREVEKGAENILINREGRPTYEPADAAEAGGLGRALLGLRYADPTVPEIGTIEFLYRRPGGSQVMNDSSWSLKTIFGSEKPRLPVMVCMGQDAAWSPLSDMTRVVSSFARVHVAKFPGSEMPFVFHPYDFTQHLQYFFKKYPPPKKKAEGDEAK